MKSKTTVATLMIAVIAMISASAATSATSHGSATTTKITLGISPFQDTLLPIIAEKKGWFKQEGLDVKLKTLGWNAIMPTVAAGGVDVAINNTTGVVSVANRAPGVIYWYGWNPFTQGSALILRPSSGLKTLASLEKQGMSHSAARSAAFNQLKGKTIVTAMATDMGKQVVAALKSVGLSTTDVKIVDLDPDQGLAAFLSGTGDAYLGGIPQRTRALSEGMQILASGPDLAPPPINGFVTTAKFATQKQDAMLRLLHVMFKTVRYCNAHTNDCASIIVGRLNSQTGAKFTNQNYLDFWQKLETYMGNASAVQKNILAPSGYSYWKNTWDGDNKFLYEESKQIPKPVAAASHFWGDKIQKLYVKKYGAREKG
jgi:ABC-type nitrate/sulfonate/bicarbonate transport system substrate-binding protein